MRALLGAFAAVQIVIGALLWLAPGFFFVEIGPYGPRNDHYMGDTATWYLANGPARLDAAGGGPVRVFVAGASGVIGRPLVRQVVAAGHDVTGMTRSREWAAAIEDAGAAAAVYDALDAAALRAAAERGAPGVYNVVDDEPAPMRDWVPVYGSDRGTPPARGAGLARPPGRREGGRHDVDDAPWRLQHAREAGARLGAPVAELAYRVARRAALNGQLTATARRWPR